MLEFTSPSVPRKFSFAFVAWLPHPIHLPIDRQIVGATVEASATMEIAMTILEKLTFSDKTQAAVMTSPEARIRRKMLDAIDMCLTSAPTSSSFLVPVSHASVGFKSRAAKSCRAHCMHTP